MCSLKGKRIDFGQDDRRIKILRTKLSMVQCNRFLSFVGAIHDTFYEYIGSLEQPLYPLLFIKKVENRLTGKN